MADLIPGPRSRLTEPSSAAGLQRSWHSSFPMSPIKRRRWSSWA